MKFTVNNLEDKKLVTFPFLRIGMASGDVYLVLNEKEAIQFHRGSAVKDGFIHHKAFDYQSSTNIFKGSLTIEVD